MAVPKRPSSVLQLAKQAVPKPHSSMLQLAKQTWQQSGMSSISQRYPILFGAFVSAAKGGGADVFVQTAMEGKTLAEWDWKRTAVFTTFGFGYVGIGQYFLLGRLPYMMFPNAGRYAAKSLAAKCRDLVGTRNLFLQVAWDQLLIAPTMFLPIYYIVKELGLSPQPTVRETVSHALQTWRTNLWEDCRTSWAVWIPFNILNYAFLPLHLRIPCMACCSMVYTVILSTTRGAGAAEVGAEAGVEVACEAGAEIGAGAAAAAAARVAA